MESTSTRFLHGLLSTVISLDLFRTDLIQSDQKLEIVAFILIVNQFFLIFGLLIGPLQCMHIDN